MLALVKSVPEPSALIASPKVIVMLAPALVTVAPLSGSKVGVAGPVVSTVNVAFAAWPWLPAAS